MLPWNPSSLQRRASIRPGALISTAAAVGAVGVAAVAATAAAAVVVAAAAVAAAHASSTTPQIDPSCPAPLRDARKA